MPKREEVEAPAEEAPVEPEAATEAPEPAAEFEPETPVVADQPPAKIKPPAKAPSASRKRGGVALDRKPSSCLAVRELVLAPGPPACPSAIGAGLAPRSLTSRQPAGGCPEAN